MNFSTETRLAHAQREKTKLQLLLKEIIPLAILGGPLYVPRKMLSTNLGSPSLIFSYPLIHMPSTQTDQPSNTPYHIFNSLHQQKPHPMVQNLLQPTSPHPPAHIQFTIHILFIFRIVHILTVDGCSRSMVERPLAAVSLVHVNGTQPTPKPTVP